MFNNLGRNNPSTGCRVFSDVPKTFYCLDPLVVDYARQHTLAYKCQLVKDEVKLTDVEEAMLDIRHEIERDPRYANLFKGTAIPFCFSLPDKNNDLGAELEDFWLPLLKKEYELQVPGTYFKATLQGSLRLQDSLRIARDTGYDIFLETGANSPVVGYFFPSAFQEFDIKSQRSRIAELPDIGDSSFCLSGPFEIIYCLICYPKLLFSREHYSPILCASALEHTDPRMTMVFKSYGPHLEFWLMSQMLTPTKTQVSEQWSGGLTVFKSL